MFIHILQDKFGFFLFVRGYQRRARRSGWTIHRPLQPTINVGEYIPDITPAEIGQLLGGN